MGGFVRPRPAEAGELSEREIEVELTDAEFEFCLVMQDCKGEPAYWQERKLRAIAEEVGADDDDDLE